MICVLNVCGLIIILKMLEILMGVDVHVINQEVLDKWDIQ